MKKLEETLKKLEEGGFMSLSLKERKAPVPEEIAVYPTRQQRKKKERYLMNLRAFRIFKMLCLLCFEIVWEKSCC